MFGPMFNGCLMNTSDDVIENMLTHKVVKGDDMNQLYDELIEEASKNGI